MSMLNVIRHVRAILRQNGGLKNTLRKAKAQYYNQGIRGIARGVRIASKRAADGRCNYLEWVRLYDTLDEGTRAAMQERIRSWPNQPKVSIVMPTYNPKPEWLIEAIESVRKQIYANWELCIADDASTDDTIRPILQKYANLDSRIKIIFREQNGHISAASNSALGLATGEWVALLDHDDVLAEHALFWVVDAINQKKNVQLIYSDEDKLTSNAIRLDPYFKCDWNQTLFYAHNLITHLGVYYHPLIRQIGGFQLGVEGAQDYDLALRCIEHIDASQVHHIPRVLYHWRVHEDSTSSRGEAKPYAMLAGERALNAHFNRLGMAARAEYVGHGFRTRYQLPADPPKVSIIVLVQNEYDTIRKCIERVLDKTAYPNFEIVLVESGVAEGDSLTYLSEASQDQRVRFIRAEQTHTHSGLNNLGVAQAQGDYVVLLSRHIEAISEEWLSELVSNALQPGIGAVGARLWYPDNSLRHGGIVLGVGGLVGYSHRGLPNGLPGYAGRAVLASEFSAISGSCLLVSKALYNEVGGFNEVNLPWRCNDIDFCLRLNMAGYRNVFTPYADLYQHEFTTYSYEIAHCQNIDLSSELNYMESHWKKELSNDPAYSPNLTLENEDFSFAWPPRVDGCAMHANSVLQPN